MSALESWVILPVPQTLCRLGCEQKETQRHDTSQQIKHRLWVQNMNFSPLPMANTSNDRTGFHHRSHPEAGNGGKQNFYSQTHASNVFLEEHRWSEQIGMVQYSGQLPTHALFSLWSLTFPAQPPYPVQLHLDWPEPSVSLHHAGRGLAASSPSEDESETLTNMTRQPDSHESNTPRKPLCSSPSSLAWRAEG